MHPKIKQMAKRMGEKESASRWKPDCGWFLYILRCQDDTFYTGVTKDLKRRLTMHNGGKASRYTRARRPVEMVYYEDCASRAQALVREYKVKALSRKKKKELVVNRKKALMKEKRNG